jgi:hypothetical protein
MPPLADDERAAETQLLIDNTHYHTVGCGLSNRARLPQYPRSERIPQDWRRQGAACVGKAVIKARDGSPAAQIFARPQDWRRQGNAWGRVASDAGWCSDKVLFTESHAPHYKHRGHCCCCVEGNNCVVARLFGTKFNLTQGLVGLSFFSMIFCCQGYAWSYDTFSKVFIYPLF